MSNLGLAALLISLAGVFVAALVGIARLLKERSFLNGLPDHIRKRLPKLFVSVALIVLSLVVISSASAFGYLLAAEVITTPPLVPTPTATLTVTDTPSPAPFLRCQYRPNEWPCIDVVKPPPPRDTLCGMANRNYGSDDPAYCQAICAANKTFLEDRFYADVPPEDRIHWDNNYCNFVMAGDELVVPIPPILTPTPSPTLPPTPSFTAPLPQTLSPTP